MPRVAHIIVGVFVVAALVIGPGPRPNGMARAEERADGKRSVTLAAASRRESWGQLATKTVWPAAKPTVSRAPIPSPTPGSLTILPYSADFSTPHSGWDVSTPAPAAPELPAYELYVKRLDTRTER